MSNEDVPVVLHPTQESSETAEIQSKSTNVEERDNAFQGNGFSKSWLQAFMEADFQLLRSDAKLDDATQVICKANDKVLVAKKRSRDYVAAIDEQYPNRAFIGELQEDSCTWYSLIGVFVSFNSKGAVLKHEMAPEMSRLECRDGLPTTTDGMNINTFLCNGRLFAASGYRRGRWHIEGMSAKKTFSFEVTETAGDSWESSFEAFGRWLCFEGVDSTMVCYDMKSLQNGSIEYVEVPRRSFKDALSSLSVPSYEPTHIEGYPLHCIKCGNKTTAGTWSWGFYMSMGSGWCVPCNMRWSHSDQRYCCTRVSATFKHHPCEAALEAPGYVCSKEHMDPESYTVSVSITEGDPRDSVHLKFRANTPQTNSFCVS